MTTGAAARLGREMQKWGGMARFRGRERAARLLYGGALRLDPNLALARRELDKLQPRGEGAIPPLGFVALGTTGTCNASCVHCPTGKASTAHVPRGTMPMEIFSRVIDGIVEEKLTVGQSIVFGLFGDGLVDPLVVERARYLRERLPDVLFGVNTNGAAFNPAKHAALNDHVNTLSLHCESLTPATYDYLMAPLRAKNVHPKYEQILAAFPGKVHVSVPVSRANLGEVGAIRDWFMARGAAAVVFDPMSSRCAEDTEVFDRLSLAPVPIRCGASIMADLIVDTDGLVLSCCQDFQRLEPIGDLARESFRETMLGLARAEFGKKLAGGCHGDIPTCSRCTGDIRTPDFPFDVAVPAAA